MSCDERERQGYSINCFAVKFAQSDGEPEL
jgi:hypothetical protein